MQYKDSRLIVSWREALWLAYDEAADHLDAVASEPCTKYERAAYREVERRLRAASDRAFEKYMKPKRIRLRRTRGFRLPDNTVIVDRRTEWGNPFKLGTKTVKRIIIKTKSQAVQEFERWLSKTTEGNLLAARAQVLLRGKNLACWCGVDEPCHAEVLLRVANQ